MDIEQHIFFYKIYNILQKLYEYTVLKKAK